jgi:hypothetical protein
MIGFPESKVVFWEHNAEHTKMLQNLQKVATLSRQEA